MSIFRNDIGIDLGTSSSLVYVRGKGIVLSEPSVVAIDSETGDVLEFGKKAQQMMGRTPKTIEAVRPLREGVIVKYDVTLKLLQYYIRVASSRFLLKPRVVICVPPCITEVEERALVDAAKNAGAGETYLIEEPVAAAIGAGIDISEASGNMVVDIGGGTTDIAVLSLDGVVVLNSIKVGGDAFDEAIQQYVKRKYDILIGERTAETVKMRIGDVYLPQKEDVMEVKGRSLSDGLPRHVTLRSVEMLEAMHDPLCAIIEAILETIERTPASLSDDIIAHGIVMTGGGSLLRGLDGLLSLITNIPFKIAENPMNCVVVGTGKALDDARLLNEVTINLARRPQPNT